MTSSVPSATARLSVRAAWAAAAVACLGTSALWGLRHVVARASTLYAAALPESPYLILDHFFLLYVALPLATTVAVLVTMAPALMTTMAFGRARSAAEWAATSFVLAFVINVAGLSLVRAAFGFPPDPGPARLGTLMLTVAASLVLVHRSARGQVPAPGWGAADYRRAAWFVGIPLALTAALLPVLVWQDFNPDGLEALSMGRSLSEHVLPRLPTGFASGLSLGMVTSSYPVSWFIAWFGPTEIAARAPLLLYVPVLFVVIVGCIEVGRSRGLQAGEEAAVFLGVFGFVVALGYSNSYHPYFADIASPANLDVLAVTLMATMVYFLWGRRTALLVVAAVLTAFDRPTGVLFLGLLSVGTVLSHRWSDVPRLVQALLPLVIAGVASVVAGAIYERGVVPSLGLPLEDPGSQIGWRLRYLTFDDFGRLAYLVVPSGIIPAFTLLALPRLDRESRVLALALLGYFAFFYVRAFVALHHFAPIMILPIVVSWRLVLEQRPNAGRTGAVAAAAIVAIVLSMPRSLEVNRTMREIGAATVYEPGDYLGSWDQYREAFDAKDVLDSIFRPYWDVSDPSVELIGSPWVHVHYASTAASEGVPKRYAVLREGSPPPVGFLRVADVGATAFVLDSASWDADRYAPRRTAFGSVLYAIDRETLFTRFGIEAENYSLDLGSVLTR
jgi:hypothetical protein